MISTFTTRCLIARSTYRVERIFGHSRTRALATALRRLLAA